MTPNEPNKPSTHRAVNMLGAATVEGVETEHEPRAQGGRMQGTIAFNVEDVLPNDSTRLGYSDRYVIGIVS